MTDLAATRARLAALKLYMATDVDIDGDRHLRHEGVDTALIWNLCGPICRQPCAFSDDGAFTYDEFGEQAYCIVLADLDDMTPLDIVGFSVRHPDAFGTLLRQAPLAGMSAITNPASFHAGPCPLWQTPLRWLQAGCHGSVVLDPVLARPVLAKAPGKFLCESWNHADWLVKAGAVPKSKLVILKLARAA